jgi:hypothetical protein
VEASTVVPLGPLGIEQAFDGDLWGNFFKSQLGPILEGWWSVLLEFQGLVRSSLM